MALIRPNSTYIKITSVRTDNNSVDYEIYQDESARNREISGTWTEFDVKQKGVFNTAVISEIVFESPFISGNTLQDVMKTLCYVAMMCDFSAFPDVILDSETTQFINNLTGNDRTQFINSVTHLINNRLSDQSERDSVFTRLNLGN